MTDSRFPERWLNDRRVMRLDAEAFRMFVLSLTWSVSNRTDGVVTRDDTRMIPGFDAVTVTRLVDSGLWETTDDGWLISVYEDTQTTRIQLEAADRKRALDRERQARHRAQRRDSSRDVTRDVTRENKGQDRTGQASVPAPQGEPKAQLEEHQVHARDDDHRHDPAEVVPTREGDCAECQRRSAFGSGACPRHLAAS